MKLHIDIETYSTMKLRDTGVYKYVECPDFEILMFAYAFNDEPVTIVDLKNGEQLPERVVTALKDPNTIKKAHNANFERVCIQKHFGYGSDPRGWRCTMVHASMLGLPHSLDKVAEVLQLSEQKDKEGKGHITYFSIPCKPTKTNGQRTRNLPVHNPERYEAYKRYCVQDVVTERTIDKKLDFFTPSPFEQRLWELDQEINDRGIPVDIDFITNAIRIDDEYKQYLIDECIELTGVRNPGSVKQLIKWLRLEMPFETVLKLTKNDIPILRDAANGYVGADVIKRVLDIRTELAKTSTTKYSAMLDCVCADGRVRGLLQYYGANRTGRWAGRLVQVQNLPKNHLESEDLDRARQCVLKGQRQWLEMMYGNVPDTLSQLIRTAFIPAKANRFGVSDFSAIEARVIAWLAGQQWRLDVFNTHGKIYEASAAQMFNVLLTTIVKGHPNYALRQKGKVAELALGYQGGVNALITMGALKMGLKEEELQPLVDAWRKANPAIVRLWYKVGEAAIEAVMNPGKLIPLHFGIAFQVRKGILFIKLPSGRELAYAKPRLEPGQYGTVLTYWGMHQTKKIWCKMYTYGGKLVENIVQAIARDCLADAMIRVDEAGYKIVIHIHDEVVAEMPVDFSCVEDINKILATPIPWANGLPLGAAGFEGYYYKKDD